MSVPQFRVLAQLRRKPAICLSTVAEMLGSSLPTASRIVSGLVTKGFIVRKACSEDRRQVSLQLTPRGQAALETAWGGTQSVLAEKLSEVSSADRAALLRSFQVLAELFGCSFAAPGADCSTERPEAESDALV